MRAARITDFGAPLEVGDVPDPTPGPTDVVIKIEAAGICRSDWHAWNGDWDWVGLSPALPVTPGHEIGGVIEEVGRDVRSLRPGDRVTVPFHEGCGHCVWCRQGRTNLCDNLEFIGFTHDGGYAEYAVAYNADYNVIKLPDNVDSMTAAAIGCRYMTAFHAVMHQGGTRPGDWVAVHGAGGVGLSAIQIASSIGANVIAIDIDDAKLAKAEQEGAVGTVDGRGDDVPGAIRELSQGGVRVSIVALGRKQMVLNSIHALVKGGRHVQVGLTSQEEQGMVALPIDLMIEHELEFKGSMGNPHMYYPNLLSLVERGRVNPRSLITAEVGLEQATDVLHAMTGFNTVGFTVINRFAA
jgi:D-arabinose 1-dehydrogenase-like Zn-dependent alcohol dehydrogenase